MSDRHVHHHGILAGLGAGAAAVLAGLVFLLLVWRRVSSQVGVAVTVVVWALVAAVLAAVAYWFVFLFLRARLHAAHPETLTRHTVRAEVIPPALPVTEAPAVQAPAPLAAIEGTRYPSASREAAEAALRAMLNHTERN